jgi:hypothetical protein
MKSFPNPVELSIQATSSTNKTTPKIKLKYIQEDTFCFPNSNAAESSPASGGGTEVSVSASLVEILVANFLKPRKGTVGLRNFGLLLLLEGFVRLRRVKAEEGRSVRGCCLRVRLFGLWGEVKNGFERRTEEAMLKIRGKGGFCYSKTSSGLVTILVEKKGRENLEEVMLLGREFCIFLMRKESTNQHTTSIRHRLTI